MPSTTPADLLAQSRSPLETTLTTSGAVLGQNAPPDALSLPAIASRSSSASGLEGANLTVSRPLPGSFTVGSTGQVGIDYLFDGGSYEGELGIFSLDGLDFNTDLATLTKEIVRRTLSETVEGHVVIRDAIDRARFDGELGEESYNAGEYQGVKTFTMTAGDHFGVILAPNGTIAALQNNPNPQGRDRPLFSLVGLNPAFGFQVGQIADVDGNGSTFVMEDQRVDEGSDRDYNDIIFQVRGAIGSAIKLAEVIPSDKDWRSLPRGQDLMRFIKPPANQPLIGVIDTGLSANNPDIDPFRIHFGPNSDYVAGDGNPLLQPSEASQPGSQHGTFITGIIGATQNNGIGIDGINDQAPIYVERTIGTGKWAQALTNFVDAAKESGQHHAIANLSLDLTQLANNGNGTPKTRYELTPEERKALEYARQNHVLVVAAAGNTGGVMSALGQASQEFGNIITVGAADGQKRAAYSGYGNGLDLLAPGGTPANPIRSTVGTDYGSLAGTSIAAAQVTGVASQMWAANPSLSDRQIIDILKSTATDLNTPGWDKETGSGLLNRKAAVDVAKTTKPENFNPAPLLVPTIWSGEGKVQPLERAAEVYVEKNFTLKVKPGNYPVGVYSAPKTDLFPASYVNPGTSLSFDRWAYGMPQAGDNYSNITSLWYSYQAGGQRYWIGGLDVEGLPPGNPSLVVDNEHLEVGYDGTWYHQAYIDAFDRNGGYLELGHPAGDTSYVHSSGNNGYSQTFIDGHRGSGAIMKSGSIDSSGSNDKAYWVGGDMWKKFQETGGIARWGYPTSDLEILIDDVGSGYIQNFQAGPLTLRSNTTNPNSVVINGHTIGGNFYPVFQQYQGTLGDPIEDVQTFSGGVSYQLFTGGSIISSPNGTFPLYGAIRQAYLNTGGLNGWMGAPTSAATDQGNGVLTQYFENGYVIWDGQQATAYQTGDGQLPPSSPSNQPFSSNFTPLLEAVDASYFNDRPQFYLGGNDFYPYNAPVNVGGTGGLGANCTWYAQGRVKEMGGSSAALHTMVGNAGTWGDNLSNGAVLTDDPQVGDIAEWVGDGHVAVVEKRNPDGSLVISESNYNGLLHHIRTIHPGDVGSQATGWPDRFIRVPGVHTDGSNQNPTQQPISGTPSGTSPQGLDFIASHEGTILSLYNDSNDNATIGIGHLVHYGPVNGSEPADFQDGITNDEALDLLKQDAAEAENAVKQYVTVPLNQAQFDALVSFTFNLGAGNLLQSDLLARLNNGEYDSVPYELSRWTDGGVQGLVTRRQDEARLFSQGIYG